MPLNHRGIGVLIFLNFVFLYIGILLFKYKDLAMWQSVLLVLIFVGYNVYILYESLNYIDTQEENLAIPVIAFVISSVCLLIVVAICVAMIFALISKMNEKGGNNNA